MSWVPACLSAPGGFISYKRPIITQKERVLMVLSGPFENKNTVFNIEQRAIDFLG